MLVEIHINGKSESSTLLMAEMNDYNGEKVMKQMRIGKGIICLAAVMMLVMMPLCACRAETEGLEDIQPVLCLPGRRYK